MVLKSTRSQYEIRGAVAERADGWRLDRRVENLTRVRSTLLRNALDDV